MKPSRPLRSWSWAVAQRLGSSVGINSRGKEGILYGSIASSFSVFGVSAFDEHLSDLVLSVHFKVGSTS
jgi:hypothetical protein